MYNSTIKRKPCKCGVCGRMPKIGLNGYASVKCMPEEVQREPKWQRGVVVKRKKAVLGYNSRKIHEHQNKDVSNLSLKVLLAEADKKFGDWIKNRDAVMGKIKCPCCNGVFGLKDKNSDGDAVVQVLHFVSRMVFSRRYSEINKAGCCYCNLKMHLDSKGIEYQNYRALLVKELDELTVSQIESERYRINRITHSQLEEIIKQYSK
jgi:hypothetical protein